MVRSLVARIAVVAFAGVALGVAVPAGAQVKLTFDKHPSLKVRKLFSVDVRL